MEPKLFGPRKFSKLSQWIDGTGIYCSRIADNTERDVTLLAVADNCGAKRTYVDFEILIDRHFSKSILAKPENIRRFDE